jgi:hypothetical protein
VTRRRWVVVAAGGVVVVLVAALGWYVFRPRGGSSGSSAGGDVVTGLRSPWGLAFLPDGSALVSERDTGRIVSIRDARATEVARIAESTPRGEGGLLGIAVAADYATEPWVYA